MLKLLYSTPKTFSMHPTSTPPPNLPLYTSPCHVLQYVKFVQAHRLMRICVRLDLGVVGGRSVMTASSHSHGVDSNGLSKSALNMAVAISQSGYTLTTQHDK